MKNMSSKDSFDKLKGDSDIKQDINRRNGEVNGKEGKRLSKRLDDVIKVISDPDQWNANISSRDRMDEVEKRLEALRGAPREYLCMSGVGAFTSSSTMRSLAAVRHGF